MWCLPLGLVRGVVKWVTFCQIHRERGWLTGVGGGGKVPTKQITPVGPSRLAAKSTPDPTERLERNPSVVMPTIASPLCPRKPMGGA